MGAAERTVRSSVTAGESGAPSQSNLARCFARSEEHTSEFQSRLHLVCRLLLEKKKTQSLTPPPTHQRPCALVSRHSIPIQTYYRDRELTHIKSLHSQNTFARYCSITSCQVVLQQRLCVTRMLRTVRILISDMLTMSVTSKVYKKLIVLHMLTIVKLRLI